ncbi:MAG: cation-translocating P-type ATPase [Chloroflexi bacterium]|nr:cation-translocating P-type ATPase [Chloroflexota bacterium]
MEKWHVMSSEEAIASLNTDIESGLTEEEVIQRLETYGNNELAEAPRPGFLERFIAQFNNFVILFLIFAAGVSFILALLEGETPVESIAILAIVILNAALGLVQEGRAEQALSALKKLAAPEAQVLRSGNTVTIPSHLVVPGDVVLLEAGDYIPADLRLVETANLKIEEASLTGESVPVDKKADAQVEESAVLGDRKNMAYMSTIVTYGRGAGVVVATGMNTEIGKIAEIIQSTEEEETPLQQRLNQLGRVLSIAALFICGLVFLLGVYQAVRHDEDMVEAIRESFIVAVSLAIAAVPEGLPAVVTINLAIGMREMIKRNALIRRLPAVETLGSATAVASDKTGTLTQNEMTAVQLYVAGQRLELSGEGYQPTGKFLYEKGEKDPHSWLEVEQILRGALLASDARLENDKNNPSHYRMVGDPTEGALVVAAAKAGFWRKEVEDQYPRVDEIPFESDRKRMSTIHKQPDNGDYVVFVKGAPDIVINLCDTIYENGKPVEITPERRDNILEKNKLMASQALRVLAVAQKILPELPAEITPETIETNLTLLGLIGLRDPARPEVREAIAQARSAGIKTVMVTGDYPDTARAIAEEIGLLRPGGQVITGAEIDTFSDEELASKLDETDAFARVSPSHKVRIVEAFRAKNHVIAMTGDGVNDAPALKRASIGVAMGITGTDVSKESADMILTDDNFASIIAAVEQGRVIYANIRKFVYFLLSSNLSEIATIFIGTLVGWPTPLTAIQLLWLNLVTDGAPALALGVEKGDPDIMDQPPRSPDEPIINKVMQYGMAIQTIIMTAVTLLAFAIGHGDVTIGFLDIEPSTELARTLAFLTLSFSQLYRAYSSRSEIFTIARIGLFTNKYMQYAFVTSAIGLILVVYVPFLQDVFEATTLNLMHWVLLTVLAIIPTIVAELSKPFLHRISDEERKVHRPQTV